MLHRIRVAMRDRSSEPLNGNVEVDETFVGGKLRFKRRSHYHVKSGLKSGNIGKTPVLGMIERKGRVRAEVVPSASKDTLVPKVLASVDPSAHAITTRMSA